MPRQRKHAPSPVFPRDPHRKRATPSSASDPTSFCPAVTALLDALRHPLREPIETLRAAMLAAAPSIEEGVKWNSASYRTTEWFATFHLRAKDSLQVVFHTGAKRTAKAQPLRIADPEGLLQWRGSDRAIATIAPANVEAHRKALQAIVRAWIAQL